MPRNLPEAHPTQKSGLSIEQKEQILWRDMSHLQLRFAEQLWQQSPHEHTSFAEMAQNNTPLFATAIEAANDPLHPTPGASRLATLLQDVNDIYARHDDDWEDQVRAAVETAEHAWRIEHPEKKRRRIGAFYFDLTNCANIPHIAPEEDALGLHVESVYKTGSTLHPRELHHSLEQIATMIADEFPYVKAVHGTSWLMDHPIAKRLGFHITDVTKPINDRSVWSQFVEKDGTLNQRRAKELLQTGRPPFVSRLGYMRVEEFLERYLPADRRSKPVQLMNVDPASRARQRNIDLEARRLRDEWESLSIESIETALSSCSEISRFLLEIRATRPFLKLLKEAKQQRLTWDAMMRMPRYSEILDDIKRELSDRTYRPGIILHLET